MTYDCNCLAIWHAWKKNKGNVGELQSYHQIEITKVLSCQTNIIIQ